MHSNHLMGHYSFHGGPCMLHGSTVERAFLNLPGGARPEVGPRQGGTGLQIGLDSSFNSVLSSLCDLGQPLTPAILDLSFICKKRW